MFGCLFSSVASAHTGPAFGSHNLLSLFRSLHVLPLQRAIYMGGDITDTVSWVTGPPIKECLQCMCLLICRTKAWSRWLVDLIIQSHWPTMERWETRGTAQEMKSELLSFILIVLFLFLLYLFLTFPGCSIGLRYRSYCLFVMFWDWRKFCCTLSTKHYNYHFYF